MYKLLLGYLLKILSNENVTIKDVLLPGILALTAYDYFGGVIKNKYMYKQYI